ncbi:hypothetical protein GKZ68_16560 [Hymenobacter sp. BRD128]|uniref:hypothetical protein n=1 Tax=Hymenobacter sp. BRD128 TaxID=2675878 RepID=UPI00156350D4|nr:hypothetical protein [Hymenobacter sp. BRD128]QKG58092.1 hypothetical protein GKZ68_16560 [Hymenobacter sp. BRD128]
MKYKLLFVVFCWIMPAWLWAQAIHFEKDSLSQMFAKARQQNKPVFLLLAPPPPSASLPLALKAERSKSGLFAPAVAEKLNQTFLSKELAFGTAEAGAAARRYGVTGYPSYLYFNPDGNLLYRRLGNSSSVDTYLRDIAAAEQARQDPQNLSSLAAEVQQGSASIDQLKRYLTKRRDLRLPAEPAVLDAYARQLPAGAFYQPAEVLFILDNGPVVGSPAFQLSHVNQKLIDSLYKNLPLQRRLAFNSLIIKNTMAQAEATKDRALAEKGANFARSTWNGDYIRGQRTYERTMLNFYQSVKDTASYLRQAVLYYERNYLNLPADTVKKALEALRVFRQRQSALLQHLDSAARQRAAGHTPVAGATTTVRPVAVGSPPASFLQELNNGAWAIYQTGTRNNNYLWHAINWSKRTVDLDPAPYNYDTLAHLLYRLGFYTEAESREQQAASLARQQKGSTSVYEHELDKMRKRTL